MRIRTHSTRQAFGWRYRSKVRWGYQIHAHGHGSAHEVTVTFVNNLDPYDEPLSPELDSIAASTQHIPSGPPPDVGWGPPSHLQRSTEGLAAQGLEALSAAASGDRYTRLHPSMSPADGVGQPSISYQRSNRHLAGRPSTPGREDMPPPISPPVSMTSSNNNLNFILNPTSTMSPPIDPNLHSRFEHHETFFSTGSPVSRHALPDVQPDATVEMEHEIAFLLRHFSETPGKWYVFFTLRSLLAKTLQGWTSSIWKPTSRLTFL